MLNTKAIAPTPLPFAAGVLIALASSSALPQAAKAADKPVPMASDADARTIASDAYLQMYQMYPLPVSAYDLDRQRNKAANGSIEIAIEKDSPGPELESNWRPAPDGGFSLTLWLYAPKPEAVDGRWKPAYPNRQT
jgi:hypothetical protein